LIHIVDMTATKQVSLVGTPIGKGKSPECHTRFSAFQYCPIPIPAQEINPTRIAGGVYRSTLR